MKKAQATVAILLTVIVGTILLSGTSLRCMWSDCTIPRETNETALTLWKDVLLVILGALSGFIVRGDDTNG